MLGLKSMKVAVLGVMIAAFAAAQAPGFLKLKVLEGEGAFNDIRHKAGHAISVEVRDENNQPMSGAEVTFSAPTFGAGGTFSNGKGTMIATANADGIATSEPVRPNLTEGRFNITVTAKLRGREGSLVVGQSNTAAGVVKSNSHKKAWIFVGIAAAAGGAAIAMAGGGSSSSGGGGGPLPTVLSTGGITVGVPR